MHEFRKAVARREGEIGSPPNSIARPGRAR